MDELDYDPYSFEIDDDPFPIYRRLRDEAPLYYNERYDFYALSRYDDVRAALLAPEIFSSALGITLEDMGSSVPPSIISMDPPEHSRQRGLISAAFTPRRVAALESSVRALARSLLEELGPKGECDVIQDFAGILPTAVICELLGVVGEDRRQMRDWTEAFMAREDGRPDLPPSAVEAGQRIQSYFEEMVEKRSRKQGDDLVSVLIAASEHEGQLSHQDLIGFLWLLLIAGNDTSSRTIGNACFWLDYYPAQRRELAAEPSLTPGAVEEILRFDGAVHIIVRTLTADTKVCGVEIPAGKKVGLLLASANRDERRFERPDVFDIHRDAGGHLGFGHGIHHCLGAQLARLEMRVALEELLARIPEFEVDHGSLVRARNNAFRGYQNMRIRYPKG